VLSRSADLSVKLDRNSILIVLFEAWMSASLIQVNLDYPRETRLLLKKAWMMVG
jgi:hypothetical protein